MILEDIVESTKERVETNKKRHSIYELKEKAFAMPIDQSFPFKKALEKEGMSYILEVKRHSPSKGQIVSTFDFKAIAKEYEMIGADAISVVTEPDYFKGDDDFLREIKRIVKIPVLRKDFVVDEYMVYESKILGADAILLIAGVLDEITLMRCVNLAHNLGMSAIVETHSSMQVKKALRVGAKIIGVNNRDLRDFSVDLNTTLKLRDMVDDDVIFVSESGIKTREDIELLEKHHVNAVLIGEAMMKSHDKRHTLEVLKGIDFEIEKIKICGLKRSEDVDYVNTYQPDYVGFVFAGKKRKITYDQAKELKKGLLSSIQVVGVFVNEDISFVEKLVKNDVIDLVQLHGQETNEYIKILKQKIDVPIIKAIQIKNDDSFNVDYDVDYYLFDHGSGGTGESFDWSMLKEVNKPVFLAGGINLSNIDEALKMNVYGLDVSSGVETDGFKDREKIKEIVRRARNER